MQEDSCLHRSIVSYEFEISAQLEPNKIIDSILKSGLEAKHVFWLIRAFDADVNAKNEVGENPLHIAALNGNSEN